MPHSQHTQPFDTILEAFAAGGHYTIGQFLFEFFRAAPPGLLRLYPGVCLFQYIGGEGEGGFVNGVQKRRMEAEMITASGPAIQFKKGRNWIRKGTLKTTRYIRHVTATLRPSLGGCVSLSPYLCLIPTWASTWIQPPLYRRNPVTSTSDLLDDKAEGGVVSPGSAQLSWPPQVCRSSPGREGVGNGHPGSGFWGFVIRVFRTR